MIFSALSEKDAGGVANGIMMEVGAQVVQVVGPASSC
jgi:hypothetical protein